MMTFFLEGRLTVYDSVEGYLEDFTGATRSKFEVPERREDSGDASEFRLFHGYSNYSFDAR
mgnify:FL=1